MFSILIIGYCNAGTSMTTVVTSSGQLDSSQTPKKRVQISDGASGTTLDLSEHKGLLGGLTPGGLEFPSTAELMHKCMSLNPFEAKFAEANRRISAGVLEANGLVAAPVNLPSTATGSAAPTLKLSTTLSQSPGIFSNISILTTDMDPSENLKTADISKLLQQACSDVGQAPRTADVLNTVLDMHGDRLHTINYLNKDLSSIFSSLTPSGSAPNSAGVLGLVTSAAAAVLPTTSGGLLSIPKIAGISPNHSPRQTNTLTNLSESTKESRQPKQTSPIRVPEVSLLSGLNADANWDPRDVKPSLSQLEKPLRGYFDSDGVGAMAAGSMPTVAIPGGSLMSFDKGEDSPTPSSRGRGRGRAAATTELPADERRYDETNCNGQDSRLRMTILERNKAAAVRYRKRKKEEHDDMVSRVHGLEQEKNNFATQNQVLRQELERVTALLREREVRCVCLKGRLPLSTDHGSDSPGDVDILSPQHGMYIPQAQQLINGLGMNNGLGLKRPKM